MPDITEELVARVLAAHGKLLGWALLGAIHTIPRGHMFCPGLPSLALQRP